MKSSLPPVSAALLGHKDSPELNTLSVLGVSFLNGKGKAMFGGGLVTRVTSSFDGPVMFAFTHAHACIPSWGSIARRMKSAGEPLLGLMKSAASKLTCPL